ncbi:MAG: AraC family transcriptional regulator [Clostridia bacterium]|nr:AraC family transcriptional regulator [Clostridia bacterium]
MKNTALYEKIPSLENNFTVKFRIYQARKQLIPHWHEHIEMLYALEGSCSFICDGREIAVKKGDLVVVNSTEIHSFTVNGLIDYFSILIYPEFLSDVAFDGISLQNYIQADSYVAGCMEDICREYKEGQIGSDMMLKSHAYRLIAYLVRNYHAPTISEKEQEARAARLNRLNKVMEYISENYSEAITTRDLAAMCFLSEAHFCRFFKRATGKSATEYINGYRIEKARVLLKNTEDSISEIASEVGFDDLNYFSRMFKRIMGISPGKYRATRKNESKPQGS